MKYFVKKISNSLKLVKNQFKRYKVYANYLE